MVPAKNDDMTLVNTGEFWDKHPDVWPGVTRYIDTSEDGDILEVWERNRDGIMVDVTERERLRAKIVALQEEVDKYKEDEEYDA